jgi:hypothetical protein
MGKRSILRNRLKLETVLFINRGRYRAVCHTEQKALSGWTDQQSAITARNNHQRNTQHSVGIIGPPNS